VAVTSTSYSGQRPRPTYHRSTATAVAVAPARAAPAPRGPAAPGRAALEVLAVLEETGRATGAWR
jgi:hypothetical protein